MLSLRAKRRNPRQAMLSRARLLLNNHRDIIHGAFLPSIGGVQTVRSIVGTWKLIAAAARDRDGNELPAPYGGKGMGCVVFNAEGRMMAVNCDGRPELPPGASRAYSSYCGTYTFDGSRLVTRVDAASDPARIGSDQVREVSFDGDRMILRPPPRQTAAGEEYRELTWERIAGE
jgi:lipocalin-like protein